MPANGHRGVENDSFVELRCFSASFRSCPLCQYAHHDACELWGKIDVSNRQAPPALYDDTAGRASVAYSGTYLATAAHQVARAYPPDASPLPLTWAWWLGISPGMCPQILPIIPIRRPKPLVLLPGAVQGRLGYRENPEDEPVQPLDNSTIAPPRESTVADYPKAFRPNDAPSVVPAHAPTDTRTPDEIMGEMPEPLRRRRERAEQLAAWHRRD